MALSGDHRRRDRAGLGPGQPGRARRAAGRRVDGPAGRVTRGSAESKGIGKQALYAQIDLDQPKAYTYAIEVMAATSQLPDARERMQAFLAKRRPRWRAAASNRVLAFRKK